MEIYIWKDGEASGPYSQQDIREAVANGSISPQQTARSVEGGDWLPLEMLLSEPTDSTTAASPESQKPASLPPPAESPQPQKAAEPFTPPTSIIGMVFRWVGSLNLLGMCLAGWIILSGESRSDTLVVCFAGCLIIGTFMFAIAEVLDGLLLIAARLRRIEKKL